MITYPCQKYVVPSTYLAHPYMLPHMVTSARYYVSVDIMIFRRRSRYRSWITEGLPLHSRYYQVRTPATFKLFQKLVAAALGFIRFNYKSGNIVEQTFCYG